MNCLNYLYIVVKITARESDYFLYFPFLADCKLYFSHGYFFLFHPHFSRLSWFGGRGPDPELGFWGRFLVDRGWGMWCGA